MYSLRFHLPSTQYVGPDIEVSPALLLSNSSKQQVTLSYIWLGFISRVLRLASNYFSIFFFTFLDLNFTDGIVINENVHLIYIYLTCQRRIVGVCVSVAHRCTGILAFWILANDMHLKQLQIHPKSESLYISDIGYKTCNNSQLLGILWVFLTGISMDLSSHSIPNN